MNKRKAQWTRIVAFLILAILVLSMILTGCDTGRGIEEEGAQARGTTHFGNLGVDGEMDVTTSGIVAEQTSLTMGMTTDTGTATGADAYLGNFTMTMDDADADLRGILMTAAASANATTASYEYGFAYDCAENTAATCTDGIILTSSGVNIGMTDGLDVSAANILNAVNVGVNPILGGNAESFTVGATDATYDFARDDAGVVTLTCSDDDATAGCVYDAGLASPIVIGSGDVTNVSVDSDVGLTFVENAESVNNLTDAAFDFTRNDAGIVTFTCSDDDLTAGCVYDAGGVSPIVIGSADVTNVSIDSDVGLTFVENSESVNNLTDAAFDFTRDDAGVVTLTSSDDDAVAGMILDAGGASPIVIGSIDVTLISLLPDNDVSIVNGATGDVVLNYHDYADSDDDDMAHAAITVNCTTLTTGAEDCDYSVGVVEGGAAAENRIVIDGDGGIDIGTANVDDVTSVAGATTAILAAPPGAGTGGDFWDLTSTFGIADGTDIMVGFDMNLTGAAHTGDGNRMCGLDIDMTTADAQVPATAIEVNDLDFDYAIDAGPVPIVATAQTWMEDFFGDTLAAEIVLLNGSDGTALDPALNQAQFGTVILVGGSSNANVAADGSEMALGLHWSADQASLIMEARVHVEDITTVVMCIGLSDSIALEIPLTIAGGDAITGVADDWVGFCYDTRSDADEWFFVGFDNTVEATGSGAVGVAPVNGIFQTLRIEVDSAGEDARGYINGTLVGTLTADVITVSDLLSPVAVIQPVVGATRTLTVDYVFVSAQRQ